MGIDNVLPGLIGRECLTGRTPLVSIQEFQNPEFMAGGRCTGLEGDMHFRTGFDGAIAVEEPVITGPRSGNTGTLVGNVQLVLLVAVGRGQVEGHILDVTQAFDRLYLTGSAPCGGGVIDSIHAHQELERIRDEGFILAAVFHGSHQHRRTHSIALEDYLVQVQRFQLQLIQRIQDGNLNILVHADILPHQRGRQGNIFRYGEIIIGQDGGDVLRFRIDHFTVRANLELIHDKGRGLVDGSLGTVKT